MKDDAPRSVLQQMLYRPPAAAAEVPLTAARAVKLAVARAAQTRIDLILSVTAVREDVLDLDGFLSALSDDLMIMALGDELRIRGAMVCDFGFAAAAQEVQTTGTLQAKAAATRKMTRADTALVTPVFEAILREIEQTTLHTSLDGWINGAVIKAPLKGPRAANFALPDMMFRVIRVTVSMVDDARSGELMIALPPHAALQVASAEVGRPTVDWGKAFPNAVRAAPACLNAVLHRFDLPLDVATQLQVGQALPLYGCTVDTVRLVDLNGRLVARGRLGQVAGQIAVRVEDGQALSLEELPPQVAGSAGQSAGAFLEVESTAPDPAIIEGADTPPMAGDMAGTDALPAAEPEVDLSDLGGEIDVADLDSDEVDLSSFGAADDSEETDEGGDIDLSSFGGGIDIDLDE